MDITDYELERYNGVRLTEEMKKRAEMESLKREKDIRHHFQTDHYTQQETNIIGFCGEFAFRKLLGLDWRKDIRESYNEINSYDSKINNWAIDVKTESVWERYLWQVVQRTIRDDEYFGRRLYHTGQLNLLKKYDILFLGVVKREDDADEIDAWFPIGWIYADRVKTFPKGIYGPVHHLKGKKIKYKKPAYQITSAALKSFEELKQLINKPRL